MKFHETHFEEYIDQSTKLNLHPALEKIYRQKFPQDISNFPNLILYGPSGVGKYTQMLRSIRRYSPSNLKYEKKINITSGKDAYTIKISDIHYEVDMSMLGCNPKILWHDIFLHIVDIVSSSKQSVRKKPPHPARRSPMQTGILVCKNFHEIHSELLDIFYSYMQKTIDESCTQIKFILLAEHISFLPDNILNCCFLLSVPRPPKAAYRKCFASKTTQNMDELQLSTITNIKYLFSPLCLPLFMPHEQICNQIIPLIKQTESEHLLKLRELLYDVFIYGLNIFECVWYFLSKLAEEEILLPAHLTRILFKTFIFFQYFNNNYRPIAHFELYIYHLFKILHY
jgi:hypothetical protein